MKDRLIRLHLDFVVRVAELSRCDRLDVGCVLTSLDGHRVLSFGYNGPYSGGPNECIRDVPGNCGCLHAEVNAVAKKQSSEPFCAFVTHTPCFACASLLINAGVHTVYARHLYRNQEGWDLLRSQGKVTIIY